jgi:hypothetical protein
MFWFAGSCFHTVTCICVRCGRPSFRGFLCGCCSRGAADSLCGRVRSGRASERVHRGSAVCLWHTDRAPLASAIPFHTHVFFSALCLWVCVCVCRTACMFMDDGARIQSPSSFWPICAFMVSKLRKPPCLVSEEEEEEEDCFHLPWQCVASTTLGPCRNGLAKLHYASFVREGLFVFLLLQSLLQSETFFFFFQK